MHPMSQNPPEQPGAGRFGPGMACITSYEARIGCNEARRTFSSTGGRSLTPSVSLSRGGVGVKAYGERHLKMFCQR